MWTVETVLNKIQQLIGEPEGSFYNIAQRLADVNKAHQEMIRESGALLKEFNATTSASFGSFSDAFSEAFAGGTAAQFVLPNDFLKLGPRQPVALEGSSSYPLEVVPNRYLDERFPAWQHRNSLWGRPQFLLLENNVVLPYAVPAGPFSISMHYVYAPPLPNFTDIPFDARPDLNEFSPGIAYRVVSYLLLFANPTAADYMRNLYRQEVNRMRHFTRTSPPKDYHIYPNPRGYTRASR